MTLPMDVEGPAAPPRSNGELVFAEPWESRAFAMAVALCEAGVFTWREFQGALIARIARHARHLDRLVLLRALAGRAGGCVGQPGRHSASRRYCSGHGTGAAARRARSRTAMTTAVRPILVTGATGRIGGTGRHVAAELLKRGLPVRALVRRLDERSEALQAMGIQVVVGDFADYASLLAALEDVEAAYFSYPVGAGLTEAAGTFRRRRARAGPAARGGSVAGRGLPRKSQPARARRMGCRANLRVGRIRRYSSESRRVLYGEPAHLIRPPGP